MKRFVIFLLIIILFAPAVLPADDVIKFGVFPVFNPKTMVKMFNPIAERISVFTGSEVSMVTAPGRLEFEERTSDGEYDLIWTSNASFLRAKNQSGYIAVAGGEPAFTGVVMVRKDSNIKTLEDLRGKSIVSTYARSVAGYLFFRNKMLDLGMYPGVDYNVSFNGNIESLPFLVINKRYDAVVFSDDTYLRTDIYEQTHRQLTVISQSIEIPQFPFAVHPDLDKYTRASIQSALISISSESDSGRQILEDLKLNRIDSKTNEDFDEFEVLYNQIKSYSGPE